MTKNKNKKITAASIMSAFGSTDYDDICISIGEAENAVQIQVKSRISLVERMSMVSDIVNMVFIKNGDGKYTYHPALRRFAYDYAIVNYFTSIDLPKTTEKSWEFLRKTNIASEIVRALNCDTISEILTEANEAIEYQKQLMLKETKLDAVLDNILDIAKISKEKLKDIELPQIMEFIQHNAPDELRKSVVDLFPSVGGVTPTE